MEKSSSGSNKTPKVQVGIKLNLDAALKATLNEELKNQLQGSLKRFANTSTPMIITGYQGLPLLETAKFLAKQKYCAEVCLTCTACKTIDDESFFQIKVVRPDGRQIKVDQIREVIESFSYKHDQMRVVIIDQAHLMNQQASNALLKTLEESPANCWIILTSPSIKNLLSTIRSRCLVYKLKPLDLSDLDLVKEQPSLKELQGRWDWIQNSEEVLNNLNQTRAWLSELKKDDKTKDQNQEDLDSLDWMKGRDGLQELMTYLRLILKSEIAAFKDSNHWVVLMNHIQNLESALQSNVDVKLVEEHLLSAIKDAHAFH